MKIPTPVDQLPNLSMKNKGTNSNIIPYLIVGGILLFAARHVYINYKKRNENGEK
jgi:hypothetical protein